MTAERPYRSAMSQKSALKELRANAGTQFNPVVVEAFIAIVDGHAAEEGRTTEIFQQALAAVRARV
jgi:HD-GYP domain-containing protein (c-di-GMP phosphodiesterase class II)